MTTTTTRRLLLGLVLLTHPAGAALGPAERACQGGRGRAVYDMIAAEGACIRRCHARGGADCRAPDGAGVARCLTRVKARALRAVLGAPCRRDCPECYGGCGADVGSGEVEYSTGLVGTFAAVVYCAADPTPAEARCARRLARAAAWFARQHGRCFVRSHAAGGDGAGSGDAKAPSCTDRARRRAAAAIDAGCARVAPACHGGLSGDGWIDLVRSAVDRGRGVIFCASPSGAFVDG